MQKPSLCLTLIVLILVISACAAGPGPDAKATTVAAEATQTRAAEIEATLAAAPAKPKVVELTPALTPKGLLTLSQALEQGLVEAQVRGNGSSSGDSIIVELTSKVPRALELTIPAGTVLRSKDPAAQNMVVLAVRGIPIGGGRFRPVSTMRLTSDDPQEFLLEAYCLDFDRENPSGSTGFSVGELASPQVQAVFEALDKVPAAQRTIGAIQTAIWAVSDDVCERELQARFQVGAADLEAAQDILEAAGIAASTCLFGGRSAAPTTIKPSPPSTPTAVSTTTLTPTPTSIVDSGSIRVSLTPMPVVGEIWQVTATSVSRMNRLQCGSGTRGSTHWAQEGYELLEVVVEFVP